MEYLPIIGIDINRKGGDLMAVRQDTSFALNEKEKRDKLLRELKTVKTQLENNDALFNFVSDPDLTEYAVYQNCALMARYRYILNAIKLIDNTAVVEKDEIYEAAAT